MGHVKIKTTQRYILVTEKDLSKKQMPFDNIDAQDKKLPKKEEKDVTNSYLLKELNKIRLLLN